MTAEVDLRAQSSFRDMINSEDVLAVISSAELEQDKLRLLGIPFIITRVTYRPGVKDDKVASGRRDYVSLELVVGDEPALNGQIKLGRVPGINSINELLFLPEEKLVINDGSTGIRRQLTMVFHQTGIINIGDIVDNSSFDRPYTEWSSFNQVGTMNGDDGDKIEVPDITMGRSGRQLVIPVVRGLRVSHMDEWDTNVFYLS